MGEWVRCFCGEPSEWNGVCVAHNNLKALVQHRLFTDWQNGRMMSHADMMTDVGLRDIPRFRTPLERDREIAAQITAMRLHYFGDWRQYDGKDGRGWAA